MATNDQIKNEMQRLSAQLRLFAKAYYIDAKPLVSDDVYNSLFARLQSLEEKFPFLKEPISVTDRVMDDLTATLRPVRHTTPMLSLRTVTQYEDEYALQWWAEMEEAVKGSGIPMTVGVQPKYDGMSVDLHIIEIDGKLRLVEASTRGNGYIGESVLHNLKHLKGMNKTWGSFEFPVDEMHLRGEALLPLKEFEQINRELVAAGKEPYVNARNAVAGILRSKETSPYADRLVVRVFGVVDASPPEAMEKLTADVDLDLLYQPEFMYESLMPAWTQEASSPEQLLELRKEMSEIRKHFTVLTDGVVYKLVHPQHRQMLGWASSYPKWAVAHKFQPEEVVTTLEAIEDQVGRTGVITPVAKLTPVVVGGVEVSSGTLSNQGIAESKGVFIGAQVIVRRAGDVVPEIVGVVPGQSVVGTLYRAPTTCPSCGGPVQQIKSNHYCISRQTCPAQLQARLEHAVGKTALDIQNLGPETLALLIEKDLIKDLIDLWHMGTSVGDLAQTSPMALRERALASLLEAGITVASANALLDALQGARMAPLDRWLTAMCIPLIGPSTAAKISTTVKDWWTFFERVQDPQNTQWQVGLGPKEIRNISEFFHRSDNQMMFARMAAIGLNPLASTVLSDGPLLGKRFVITGSFGALEKPQMGDALRRLGASVSTSVSAKTDCLIAGESPGPEKTRKARELKILQIDQGAYEHLLKHPEALDTWRGNMTVTVQEPGVIISTF